MENVCAKCHKHGTGCCFFKESGDSQQIGIFLEDIYKIERYLDAESVKSVSNRLSSVNSFVVKDEIDKAVIEFVASMRYPLFDKIFYKNIRFKLKTVDEKCIFWDEHGCTLPEDIRPLYCRVFPFWPSLDFQNIFVLSHFECLAQEKSNINWKTVNQHFNYTEEYLKKLFEMMKAYAEKHVLSLSMEKI